MMLRDMAEFDRTHEKALIGTNFTKETVMTTQREIRDHCLGRNAAQTPGDQ